MENSDLLALLPGALLPWFQKNQRDLPWRKDREPYHIWVSEIMLQQTRVEAVRGYYLRFLQELPTVQALAQCEDERLQKLWEGLGYYSRVRNLKKAAGVIVSDWDGVFPQSYQDVLALPGIGEYTAGAICSIAYNQRVPAVDGNVLRVCSRIMNDSTPIDRLDWKASIRTELAKIYPSEAGAFTQALMELGATVCGPNRQPCCENCPCASFCLGYRMHTAEALPVKNPKKEKKQEDRTVFVLSCSGKFALSQRADTGLLAGLLEFPNVAGKLEPEAAMLAVREMGLHPRELYRMVERKHIFTHIQWNLRGFYLEVQDTGGAFRWLTAEEIETKAALPTAFRQFWFGADSGEN